MDIRAEIAARVNKLSPDVQEQVLRFVTSLETTAPAGENGTTLRRFSGLLDKASAREMMEATEEECERVDAVESTFSH